MLRPSKHAHPDRTIINVSMLITVRLKKKRIEEFDSLKSFVRKNVVGGEVLLLPALNLLFLLGLVEYLPKTDSLEYTGQNETV